eukprot:SAG31_NODE_17458_length_670_cov_0.570928_1_plen_156_part_01
MSSDGLREAYGRDGFALVAAPLIPRGILQGALAGVEALRQGRSDGGEPLAPDERAVIFTSPTGAGDAEKLCKLELPQLGSQGIRTLVSLSSIGEQVGRATGAKWAQVFWTQLLGKPPANGKVSQDIYLKRFISRHLKASQSVSKHLETSQSIPKHL